MSTKTRKRGRQEQSASDVPPIVLDAKPPLWSLDIVELTGHNLEARGRKKVNRLLAEGWILLHVYTLKYPEDGAWREWPMAVLGRRREKENTVAVDGEVK